VTQTPTREIDRTNFVSSLIRAAAEVNRSSSTIYIDAWGSRSCWR
jgi:hypothetical protein